MKNTLRRWSLILIAGMLVAACASGPTTSKLPTQAKATDAPYQKLLVVSLFKTSDMRERLEQDVVAQLAARNVKGVALTSLRGADTPVTREEVVRAVQSSGADAVLVTQLISLETSAKSKDRSPQGSYKVGATPYFDVYTVETKEFVEPPSMELKHKVSLRTDLYSVSSEQIVWALGSKSQFKMNIEDVWDYSRVTNEAKAIVSSLARDKMLAR